MTAAGSPQSSFDTSIPGVSVLDSLLLDVEELRITYGQRVAVDRLAFAATGIRWFKWSVN